MDLSRILTMTDGSGFEEMRRKNRKTHMVMRKVCLRFITALSFACLLMTTVHAGVVTQKKRARKSVVKKIVQRKKNPIKKSLSKAVVPCSVVLIDSQQEVLPEDASIPLQKRYVVSQGKTLHLKITAPHPLNQAYAAFAGTRYNFAAVADHDNRYECFIPIDCEQLPGEYKVIVKTDNELGVKKNIGCAVTVNSFPFKMQRGFKISKKKLQSIRSRGVGGGRDSQLVKQYQKNSHPHKLWDGAFRMPINVRQVTSSFGEIRTSHGFGKRHHYGLDLYECYNAPIYAANHGIVANKTHTPTSGNVVAIDHGLGVFTIYCHMNSFEKNIKIGDFIKKGQRIGFIGQTGYASGPHLHLELRIKDANNQRATAVDFMEWTQNIY